MRSLRRVVVLGGLVACASQPRGRVHLDPVGPDGALSGSFDDATGPVAFTATADGQGAAEASYTWPSGATVEVVLDAEGGGTVAYDGLVVDGRGTLTPDERAAVETLLGAALGPALTSVPLELGCREEVTEPLTLGALVLPWQLGLKYLWTDPEEAVLELALASTCGYFDDPVLGEELGPPGRTLMLGPEAPFPVVFGVFPLDEVGAAEGDPQAGPPPAWPGTMLVSLPAAPARSAIGPCNARCRGACGVDCTVTNCSVTYSWRCAREDNANTGFRERWTSFDCGVAAGCIVHDDCYDACNAAHGCTSYDAVVCRHARFRPSCDGDAQSQYGLTTAASWAQGLGPFEVRETFHYPVPGSTTLDRTQCPASGSGVSGRYRFYQDSRNPDCREADEGTLSLPLAVLAVDGVLGPDPAEPLPEGFEVSGSIDEAQVDFTWEGTWGEADGAVFMTCRFVGDWTFPPGQYDGVATCTRWVEEGGVEVCRDRGFEARQASFFPAE